MFSRKPTFNSAAEVRLAENSAMLKQMEKMHQETKQILADYPSHAVGRAAPSIISDVGEKHRDILKANLADPDFLGREAFEEQQKCSPSVNFAVDKAVSYSGAHPVAVEFGSSAGEFLVGGDIGRNVGKIVAAGVSMFVAKGDGPNPESATNSPKK